MQDCPDLRQYNLPVPVWLPALMVVIPRGDKPVPEDAGSLVEGPVRHRENKVGKPQCIGPKSDHQRA